MNDVTVNESKLTRIEVIDSDGRSYVHWSNMHNITLSVQDEGKTLKVFIKEKKS